MLSMLLKADLCRGVHKTYCVTRLLKRLTEKKNYSGFPVSTKGRQTLHHGTQAFHNLIPKALAFLLHRCSSQLRLATALRQTRSFSVSALELVKVPVELGPCCQSFLNPDPLCVEAKSMSRRWPNTRGWGKHREHQEGGTAIFKGPKPGTPSSILATETNRKDWWNQ